MCISALIEPDLQKIAPLVGLHHLLATAPAQPGRRVEARQTAWVVRQARGGRLVAEPMCFNPYVVRHTNIVGDMWASSLLGANHGIVVVRSYSNWVRASALVEAGLIGAQDVHCAFNRAAPRSRYEERQLMVNFSPQAPLLVPVLFDRSRVPVVGQENEREFVLISGQPPAAVAAIGLVDAPLNVSIDTAMEWLHTDELDLEAFDCEALLADLKPTACSLALYKSA